LLPDALKAGARKPHNFWHLVMKKSTESTMGMAAVMVLAIRLIPDWKDAVYEKPEIGNDDVLLVQSMEEISQLSRADLPKYLEYCKRVVFRGRAPWKAAKDHVEWLETVAKKGPNKEVRLFQLAPSTLEPTNES